MKEMESQNSSLTAQLEESHTKIDQLEDQHMILTNNMITVGKEIELLKQQELKAKSEIGNLEKKLSDCKSEKDDLAGKLKMALIEFVSQKHLLSR